MCNLDFFVIVLEGSIDSGSGKAKTAKLKKSNQDRIVAALQAAMQHGQKTNGSKSSEETKKKVMEYGLKIKNLN